MPRIIAVLSIILLMLCSAGHAAEIHAAVAANFTDTAKALAATWEEKTGNKVILSYGSTGQLYAQISQGAPFDIFLAADQATVKRIADEGLGSPLSRFTYAIGKLVLYSERKDLALNIETLRSGQFAKLAIANPMTAPYGMAAIETMKSLGVSDQINPKIVQGQNISQAFQFVATGNADLGFVALSQTIGLSPTSYWIVPNTYYSPLKQDAILLNRAKANKDAEDFLNFLKDPAAMQIIKRYGYDL